MAASNEKRYVIVECSHCDAVVKAEALATHMTKEFHESVMMDLPSEKVSLLVCPSCHEALVSRTTWEGEGDYGDIWSKPQRVWPRSEREASLAAPAIVRVSLEEAQRCYRAAAYTACVVMSGRALEGVCRHFQTKSVTLHKGLAELLDRQIIDQRLFSWGEELRKHRNLAAHASEHKFAQDDATDLMDFVSAICEYVFVLTPKFESFLRRRTQASGDASRTPTSDTPNGEQPRSAKTETPRPDTEIPQTTM